VKFGRNPGGLMIYIKVIIESNSSNDEGSNMDWFRG
jgi:hypothetical protein